MTHHKGRLAIHRTIAMLAPVALLAPIPAVASTGSSQAPTKCEIGEIEGEPIARHEAGFIAFEGKLYLLGGRGVRQVSIFDPETLEWRNGAHVPLELHHFQPIVVGDEIWIVGAMSGRWPTEQPLRHVWRYLPHEDRFERGIVLPENRLRGGGGVVLRDGRIWWAGGITNGHTSGTVGWLDSYDFADETWREHPDMPHPRDHWQMVTSEGRLYAVGGRNTGFDADDFFEPIISETDVYDIDAGSWLPGDESLAIPTPRAGLMAAAIGSKLVYVGGESGAQKLAHSEVEILDIASGEWSTQSPLNEGRHASGLALSGGRLYVASGSGQQGGSPELTSMECIPLP